MQYTYKYSFQSENAVLQEKTKAPYSVIWILK